MFDLTSDTKDTSPFFRCRRKSYQLIHRKWDLKQNSSKMLTCASSLGKKNSVDLCNQKDDYIQITTHNNVNNVLF